MKHLGTFLCVAAAFLLSAAHTAHAQASKDTLGYDPTTNAKYECQRFGDPNLNSVLVTTPGKAAKVLKISAAKRGVTSKINKVKERKGSLRELIKDAKAAEKKLHQGGLATSVNEAKIAKAREKIAKLSSRLAEADLQIEVLKQLNIKIPDCSKPADPFITGTVQFISGVYNGGANWYVWVVYLVDSTKLTTGEICAGISGEGTKHIDKGWSGGIYPDTPATTLTPKSNLCAIPYGFECIDPKTQAVVVFGSKNGPQSAGCTNSNCDLGLALAEAHAFYDGVIVYNVTNKKGSGPCPG